MLSLTFALPVSSFKLACLPTIELRSISAFSERAITSTLKRPEMDSWMLN